MSDLAMQPFFAGEFMRETRGWSILEKGGYRELRDAQWDLGGLPADGDELRRLINATEQEWSVIWKRCETKFPLGEDGLRRNSRLEQLRSEALEKKHIAITKAKNAAAARWGNDAPSIPSGNASGMPQAMHEQCPPSPSPSPSPEPSPSPSAAAARAHARGNGAAAAVEKLNAERQRWQPEQEAFAQELDQLGVTRRKFRDWVILRLLIADHSRAEILAGVKKARAHNKPEPERIPPSYLSKIVRKHKPDQLNDYA